MNEPLDQLRPRAAKLAEALLKLGPDYPLDTKEAANLLRVSASFLNNKRITGGGPAFLKVGRKVLYRRSDLTDWLDRQRRTSTSQAAA